VAALLLAACTSVELPAGPRPFDPIAFFAGPTEGRGRLDILLSGSRTIHVQSLGTRTKEGGLLLVQNIREEGKAARVRRWVMKPDEDGDGVYHGTLTDADGPVTLAVRGARATISYRTPDGVRIDQQLALQADGRTLLNHLGAYKFGLRVATLEETIRRPVAK
jgi:hypothetical protein